MKRLLLIFTAMLLMGFSDDDKPNGKIKQIKSDYPQITEYNKHGDIVKEVFDEIMTAYYSYEYDNDGRKTIGMHSFMCFVNLYKYEYNNKGQITKSAGYSDGAGVWFVHKYEYDSAGKRIKNIYYETDCEYEIIIAEPITNYTLISVYKFIDNSNNEGYSNRLLSTTNYEYDSDARLIKETQYSASNELLSTTSYEYDSDGNKTEVSIQDADQNIIIKEYAEFDDNGNWQKITLVEDDKTPVITKRELTYYE